MKTRIISAVVAFPLFFLLVFTGGNLLFLGTLLMSLIGIFELYKAFDQKANPMKLVGYAMVIAFYSILFFSRQLNQTNNATNYVFILLVVGVLALMTTMVIKYPKYNIFDIAVTFFGFAYVGIIFSIIYIVREMSFGSWLVWYIFITAWASDTFAYFTGMFLGKRKLSPELSPKKTIEGSIGGIIGSMIICLIYGIIFKTKTNFSEDIVVISLLIGFVGAIMGQIGDLSASAIKRYVSIKDYGKLIPGHGGILDRFDSILFTAPIVYIAINILLKLSI